MSYCAHCGGRVQEGSAFCPNCGIRLLPDNSPRPDTQHASGQELDFWKEDRTRYESDARPAQPSVERSKAAPQSAYRPAAVETARSSRPNGGLTLAILAISLFVGCSTLMLLIRIFGLPGWFMDWEDALVVLAFGVLASLVLSIIGLIKGIRSRCRPAIILSTVCLGILHLVFLSAIANL